MSADIWLRRPLHHKPVMLPVAFATKLENAGLDVDFLLAWNRPHSGDYALDEVFCWIRQITGR